MPINEVTIVSRCARCSYVLATTTVKKDNMRLMSSDLVWCEKCQADCPQVRDILDRESTVSGEQSSYPGNPAVENVSAAEFRRGRSANPNS
jgi:hypothetical protein